ncbi:LysR substrate-binding domain-containing protein [Roseovarius sp. S4756]|uniref:LysR substrate-binding domain-containing protein n=1 Tax=Roseovarius maritimus TaxID=3342637 RepID=UPI003727D3AF
MVSLDLTDRDIDFEAVSFDAAICFAEQHNMPDIVLRKLMQSRRNLCASPGYPPRAGPRASFGDLAGHSRLQIAGSHERNEWITEGAPRARTLRPRGISRATAPMSSLARRWPG